MNEYVESIISSINGYLTSTDEVLKLRLNENMSAVSNVEGNIDFENKAVNEERNMTEKFDLKTAAATVPIITRTEDSVTQLVNAIEMYDSLLDDTSKNC